MAWCVWQHFCEEKQNSEAKRCNKNCSVSSMIAKASNQARWSQSVVTHAQQYSTLKNHFVRWLTDRLGPTTNVKVDILYRYFWLVCCELYASIVKNSMPGLTMPKSRDASCAASCRLPGYRDKQAQDDNGSKQQRCGAKDGSAHPVSHHRKQRCSRVDG